MEKVRGSSPLSPTILTGAALATLLVFPSGRQLFATPPSPIRLSIGRVEPWPQSAGDIALWFQAHEKELAGRLNDQARLKRLGRGAPSGQLLFAHVALTAIDPPAKDLAVSENEPADIQIQSHSVEMIYQVRVPRAEAGQAWAIHQGEVITGYRRPMPDVSQEKRWEEIRDGQRFTRTEKRSIAGQSEPIGADKTPQPGDQPVAADSFYLYIDKEGVVYL